MLKELEIPYTRYEHKPAYTPIADHEGLETYRVVSVKTFCAIKGEIATLFVIIEQTKKANLADLAEKIGSPKLLKLRIRKKA